MSIKIDTMLFELANARNIINNAEVRCAEARLILENTKEWQDLNDCKAVIDVGRKKIEELEKDIREVALEEYAENQVKDLGGIQIKIFTTLEYDENTAVNYCLEHQHANLLKLNKTGFEKVAKELKPDFVKIEEVARAQIASDLSEYLEK